MLEHFYDHPLAIRRVRNCATGPHLDGFAAYLSDRGYSWSVTRDLLRGAWHLGVWLDHEAIATADLDEHAVECFVVHIAQSEASMGKLKQCRSAAWRFLGWGRSQSLISTEPPAKPPIAAWIVEFEAWMLAHRNVVPVTLTNYRLPLTRLAAALGGNLGGLTARTLRSFIDTESRRAGRGTTKQALMAMRSFVSYLVATGQRPRELMFAIPKMPRWKLAALPPHVQSADVERVVSSCDPATSAGKRDRAMLLLMARLGLRAGDVARLRVGDLDWSDAVICVAGKGRRAARLPLPQDVGDAILAWLDVRPGSEHDHVFLRLPAPSGPVTSGSVVHAAVRAQRRAGFEGRTGAHLLRHGAATALLEDGVSLPVIGALLRHQNIETTRIYAKVDASLLTQVARPWPTGGGC